MHDLNGIAAARTMSEVRDRGFLYRFASSTANEKGDPRDVLSQWIDQRRYQEAAVLLAALLPVRLSVWWSCLCAWHSVRPAPSAQDDRALRSATAWTIWPVEENRSTAEAITLKDGIESAAQFCAKAAALAGRIRGPEGPFDLAFPVLAAQSAGAAILRAAKAVRIKTGANDAEWPMLYLGLQVARGAVRLPKPAWKD